MKTPDNVTIEHDGKITLPDDVLDRYTFAPQETKTVYLTPRKYKFHASAAGVIPDFGEQTFQSGYRYTWRFDIVTTYK